MNEFALVALVGVLIAGLGAAGLLPWDTLLEVGIWLSAAGMAFGVPTGVVYHVALYRALAPRGELPRGWIWRPLELHDRLTRGEHRRVVPWAVAGGAGFAVIVLGLIAMAMSVVSVAVRGV